MNPVRNKPPLAAAAVPTEGRISNGVKLHDIFFWFACFFLAGVLVASVVSGFTHAYLIAGLFILLLFLLVIVVRRKSLVVDGSSLVSLSLVVLSLVVGSVYFFAFDYAKQDNRIIFGEKVQFSGVIREAEQRLSSQKLVIENIQINTSRYPAFDYGDEIKVVGVVKKPDAEFASYYKKEGIAGVVGFPEIELVSSGNGSPVKAQLLKIKSFFESSFKKVLPFDQAVFMAGLTLGETAEFSDELKEKLRATGTSHLVALSGYNISVIISTVINLLALWWFTKRFSFWISSGMVLGFVVMTGAEASVVRAAMMGFLILLADKLHRVYYFRNAVAATALVMVGVNPHILAFDIGFQLSFAALLGITYFQPWIEKKLKWQDKSGYFNWRKHLTTTTSAQIAVLPILLYHFGQFSPIGLISNVLLLEFIPITMGLGFFIGFASLIAYPLAWALSFPASILLGYELGVINVCAKIITAFSKIPNIFSIFQ
ncbi:MAG: ComEC/Rec2 family competence protein [bacterium]|nr:ComEC/Rec2 family competence protein [bacterium]